MSLLAGLLGGDKGDSMSTVLLEFVINAENGTEKATTCASLISTHLLLFSLFFCQYAGLVLSGKFKASVRFLSVCLSHRSSSSSATAAIRR